MKPVINWFCVNFNLKKMAGNKASEYFHFVRMQELVAFTSYSTYISFSILVYNDEFRCFIQLTKVIQIEYNNTGNLNAHKHICSHLAYL